MQYKGRDAMWGLVIQVLASPIFNSFTQTNKASSRGNRRALWSQDFVDKLTTTASSLRSMDTRWLPPQP